MESGVTGDGVDGQSRIKHREDPVSLHGRSRTIPGSTTAGQIQITGVESGKVFLFDLPNTAIPISSAQSELSPYPEHPQLASYEITGGQLPGPHGSDNGHGGLRTIGWRPREFWVTCPVNVTGLKVRSMAIRTPHLVAYGLWAKEAVWAVVLAESTAQIHERISPS